jgi:hypothetical protein
MKNLLKINGAQQLSKSELLSINGGTDCPTNPTVPPGYGICVIGKCRMVYHCESVCPDGTDPFCYN